MVFLFILQYLPVFPQKGKKSQKGVDELTPLSHKTAACTYDIISYAPAVNTVNRCDVMNNLDKYI